MGNGEAEDAAARRDIMVQRSEEREREGGRERGGVVVAKAGRLGLLVQIPALKDKNEDSGRVELKLSTNSNQPHLVEQRDRGRLTRRREQKRLFFELKPTSGGFSAFGVCKIIRQFAF